MRNTRSLSPARYCLTKREVQMILDANDTLAGEKITPVTANLEAYGRLIANLTKAINS